MASSLRSAFSLRLRCLRTPAASSMNPRRSSGVACRIVSSWPGYGPQKLDVPMFALFDQKIDAKAVLAKTSLSVGGKSVPIEMLDDAAIEKHKTIKSLVDGAKAAEQDGRWRLQGDPTDEHALARALAGHDAVVSALGPPGPGKTTIHRDAARATLAAMKRANVDRLVVVSAAVLFDGGLLYSLLRATLLRNIAAD